MNSADLLNNTSKNQVQITNIGDHSTSLKILDVFSKFLIFNFLNQFITNYCKMKLNSLLNTPVAKTPN